jgi:hypothetical protein
LVAWANRAAELSAGRPGLTFAHWQDDTRQVVEKQVTDVGLKLDARICVAGEDYTNGSNLGYLLLQKYIALAGVNNYLAATRTLYLKYRFTGQSVMYDDVYRAYVYFAPSEKTAEIKAFLAPRLCIPEADR